MEIELWEVAAGGSMGRRSDWSMCKKSQLEGVRYGIPQAEGHLWVTMLYYYFRQPEEKTWGVFTTVNDNV